MNEPSWRSFWKAGDIGSGLHVEDFTRERMAGRHSRQAERCEQRGQDLSVLLV